MDQQDQNRFQYLLQKYLENQSSEEEDLELFRKIGSGNYDFLMDQGVKELFENDQEQKEMPPGRAEAILREVLTSHNEKGQRIQLSWSGSWWMAAAVIVIVSVTGWLFWNQSLGADAQYTVSGPSSYTGKQFVRLPDGTMVILNDSSELSYTATFGQKTREVMLKGEGYFDVHHDPERPFKVLTGEVVTTVLGTAFNIKAYRNQEEVRVTVVRGKVEVGNARRSYGILTPDQQITINTATDDFERADARAENAIAWKKSFLILEDITIDEAAKILEEKYNVRIIFANQKMKACRITATFLQGESLEQVLTVLTGVLKATYTQEKSTIIIEGPDC